MKKKTSDICNLLIDIELPIDKVRPDGTTGWRQISIRLLDADHEECVARLRSEGIDYADYIRTIEQQTIESLRKHQGELIIEAKSYPAK